MLDLNCIHLCIWHFPWSRCCEHHAWLFDTTLRYMPSQIRILRYYECVVTIWKETQVTNQWSHAPSWSVSILSVLQSLRHSVSVHDLHIFCPCPFVRSTNLCVCVLFYAVTSRQSHQHYLHSISYRVIHASLTFNQPWGACVCVCMCVVCEGCRYMHATHPILMEYSKNKILINKNTEDWHFKIHAIF